MLKCISHILKTKKVMDRYVTWRDNLTKRYPFIQQRSTWVKVGVCSLGIWLFMQKDVSVQLHLSNPDEVLSTTNTVSIRPQTVSLKETGVSSPKNTSTNDSGGKAKAVNISHNLANTYSNMTYENTKFATTKNDRARGEKRKKQLAYVAKFAKIAQQEMEKFGIPASVTLAQGLIESNCGDSRLATKNNNHFGMKCFSKKCKKGHCSNFTDDSHKDFFRIYKSAWESYRAHSNLLMGKRYKELTKYGTSNYVDWAKGLKKAGYATDPHYATKLISIVESLELYKYDK